MSLIPYLTSETGVIKALNTILDAQVESVETNDAGFQLMDLSFVAFEGVNATNVSRLAVTVEFGFDAVVAPDLALFISTTDFAGATAESRRYVSASSSGYIAGSYTFVLTRGVDYEVGTTALKVFIGRPSGYVLKIGVTSMSASLSCVLLS